MKTQRILIFGSLAIVLALMIAILLPPGNRSLPRHMVDINNMRQIAIGLAVFAHEYNSAYPESLSEAFNPEHGIFTEGSYREMIFSTARNSHEEVLVSEIDEKTDWIYVRGHTVSSPPDLIVLFTPAGRFTSFTNGEMLVAKVDGNGLIMEEEAFIRSMNRTLAYLHSSTVLSEPDGGINSESLRSSP